jgi:hypothetical protein
MGECPHNPGERCGAEIEPGIWAYGKTASGTFRYVFRQEKCVVEGASMATWDTITAARLHAADQRMVDVVDGSADAIAEILSLSAYFKSLEVQSTLAEMLSAALSKG